MGKKVCIIIPVKNISPGFDACIKSVLNLNYNNFEIIIVDDSEKGDLQFPADNYNAKIQIFRSHGKGPSCARNLAVRKTNADFLAFTDSDCIVDKDWLIELLKGFELFPEAAACGGIQKLPGDATSFEKKVFLFMQKTGFITDYMRQPGKKNIIAVSHNASCCVIYKKDIFLEIGGFLEGLWPGEDVELDFRLIRKGYKLIFNPGAMVYHHRPKNLEKFSAMMYRYGEAMGILTRRYGIFRKIQLLPVLSVSVIVLFSLAFLSGFLPLFLMAVSTVLCLLFIYVRFNLNTFFLCCLSFVYWNMGFLKRFISGKA